MAEEVHFSPNLANKLYFAQKSCLYGQIHILWSFLFLLVPHMKASFESNTVLIRAELRAVCTFLLYFCISSLKDSSKFQHYFMYGGIPHLYAYQQHQGELSFHLMPTINDLIWKLQVLFWKTLACYMFVQSFMKKFAGRWCHSQLQAIIARRFL